MKRHTLATLFALVADACSQSQKPAVIALPPNAPVQAETVRRYDFLMGAGRAGEEVVRQRGNERDVHFEFNDRGRGPKTDSVIVTDSRSIPLSISNKGNDYLKAAVHEEFANGTWSTDAEKGHSDNRDAVYVSMNGAPDETGVLAKALLAASGQKLALLPAGEASIRGLGDVTLDHEGRKEHVTCYAITGFDFTPSPIWLDDTNELFASVSSWSSVIREGWGRDVARQLIDKQKTWSDTDAAARTQRLTHHPRGGAIAITNARVFDPVTMTLTASTTIVVRGNRIERVGPDGSVTTPNDAEQIDARGRTVLPGLWDMHTHNSEDQGMLNIANGVTSVRDLGNDVDFIVALKKKYERNETVGPRIVLAALIDGPGPYTGPTKLVVDSEADVTKVLDRVQPLGFEQTKIYSSIRPELVPFIAKASHERGMRVHGSCRACRDTRSRFRRGAVLSRAAEEPQDRHRPNCIGLRRDVHREKRFSLPRLRRDRRPHAIADPPRLPRRRVARP